MNSIAQPKMVAMSKDGEDAIWVWGEGEKATAVISPKKPVTRTGERPLMALIAHLQLNEWHFFDPR